MRKYSFASLVLFTHRVRRGLFCLSCVLWLGLAGFISGSLQAREFSVMVYNVENFFDADGTALFNDYVQGRNKPYSSKKLWGKVRNLGRLMEAVRAEGTEPEIIAFQEFEFDFTPDKTPVNYAELLMQYENTTVEKMLTGRVSREVANLPVEFFVLKHLEDLGLKGYRVAMKTLEDTGGELPEKPHVNVLFSKFPIQSIKTYPLEEARNVLEVKLEVDGYPLYVFNNHWKSNRGGVEATEKVRMQNAQVLRDRVDQILGQNPSADILVVGDLNSQYNQTQIHVSLERSGINDTLLSQGDESIMTVYGQRALYNLWYELPRAERKSDSFDNRWGTLMHLILSSGLYDQNGIQYVDNSFSVIAIPELNALEHWGLPFSWHHGGDIGGGFSDHFPLLARFRTVSDNQPKQFMTLQNPGKESPQDAQPLTVDFKNVSAMKPYKGEVLEYLSDAELPEHYGRIFEVKTKISGKGPEVTVGQHQFVLFSHNRNFRRRLFVFKEEEPIHFYGQLGEYKGKKQFVLLDPTWLLD